MRDLHATMPRSGLRASRAPLVRVLSLLAVVWAVALAASCVGPLASPSEELCPLALLDGELLADDAGGLMVRHAEGFLTTVVWPDGYTVRDGEVRELLDPSGRVVAREGDHVSLGGGMDARDAAFVVCGPFEVAPR